MDVVSQDSWIHDILCEIIARARREMPAYVHRHYDKYLRSIVQHLTRITAAQDNDTERVQAAVDALLPRPAEKDLLATLISCACRSDENHQGGGSWHGVHCGPTTHFWTTQVLALARKSVRQVETSSDITGPSIADQLRAFCFSRTQCESDSDGDKQVGISRNRGDHRLKPSSVI